MKFKKILSVLIIFFILISVFGCLQKPANKYKQNKEKEVKVKISKKEKKSKTPLPIVKKYLSLASDNKNAVNLIIENVYEIKTKDSNLIIKPNKTIPFSYVKTLNIKEQNVKTIKPKGSIYQYTITADIKWKNDNKLINNYIFFIIALKENSQWKIDGISTEF